MVQKLVCRVLLSVPALLIVLSVTGSVNIRAVNPAPRVPQPAVRALALDGDPMPLPPPKANSLALDGDPMPLPPPGAFVS
jgi:hypothetical protein